VPRAKQRNKMRSMPELLALETQAPEPFSAE